VTNTNNIKVIIFVKIFKNILFELEFVFEISNTKCYNCYS